MDKGLLLIFVLTFVIHLIGTLAYSVRIAGTRTRRIAISLSLFNILVLVSRTSNSFAAPLLPNGSSRTSPMVSWKEPLLIFVGFSCQQH